MTLDTDALRTLLCERLCEEARVDQRPDGDRFPIHVSESASGGLRLSDCGHTLMHISYEHDIDSFMDGTRGMILERIMGESGLRWDADRGAFCLDAAPERLPEATFAFGQALTRVYDPTLLSRSNVGPTFYDDLAELLFSYVDEAQIERDFRPDVPNADAYPVDYRIENKCAVPLFLYGVPNRDKARLNTIMLSHFHRYDLRFESILVFED